LKFKQAFAFPPALQLFVYVVESYGTASDITGLRKYFWRNWKDGNPNRNGRVGAGEGLIGLSWALFVAGAPATVFSQWKVELASTRELMLDFYRTQIATKLKTGWRIKFLVVGPS